MKRILNKQAYTNAIVCSFQRRLLARPEKISIYILFLILLLTGTGSILKDITLSQW